MLINRIVSGLVLAVVVAAMIWGGVIPIAIGAFIAFGIALYEYQQLFASKDYHGSFPLMLLWLVLFFASRLSPDLNLLPPGAAVLLIVCLMWMERRYTQGDPNAMYGFIITIAASFHVGWTGSHFVSLRGLDDGLWWTYTAVIANMSADSFAYMVGSLIGRNKLVPRISPNKTWEGYIGAIVLTIALTAASTLLWRQLGASPAVSPLHGAMIGALVSIIGPVGDLGISVIKRTVGAKNTGNLIPGHGGLLDRVDVLVLTSVISYYYVTLVALQ